ncbi:MAG: hypothetical protein U0353_02140 [Sandaracinus sp.]
MDQIELLPSALEVVLAEDTMDETYVAFQSTGALTGARLAGICRPETVAAFGDIAATGNLGPATGAPLP